MHGRASKQFIFSVLYNTSTFNVYVLMKVLSRASAKKKTERHDNLRFSLFNFKHSSHATFVDLGFSAFFRHKVW